ncbi:MAG: AEC family transporter [Lachnospiraceae bacterium]|nr:AEC family transporter [Lachnospiraceae bacterium]
MTLFEITINQLTQFFMMLVAGYFMAKIKLVRQEALGDLSKLITKVFLPAAIFSSTYNGADRKMLLEGLPVLGLTALMYLFLTVTFFLISKLLQMKGEKAKVFQALFIFGNTGFVGLPLLQALYPQNGVLCLALFSVIDQMILWTYGIYLTDNKNSRSIDFKKFLNPALIVLVFTCIFILLDIKIPSVVRDTVGTMGKACTAVCMIYLGALACFSDIGKAVKSKEVYVGIAVKMIIFPLLVCTAVSGMKMLDGDMRNSLVILSALPTMTAIPVLVQNGGNEGEYAIGATMLTFIAGMATLPWVVSIL